MALEFTTSYIQDSVAVFRYYKRLAERAMEQVTEAQLFEALDDEANSIAVIVKHMTGNMRSRWTDFLTTDGEKPDRNRDGEFVDPPETRAALMKAWEDGWACLFGAIEPLTHHHDSRGGALGDAGDQPAGGALPASCGADCAAGEAFLRRRMAISQRAAEQVGGVQPEGGGGRGEPAITDPKLQ